MNIIGQIRNIKYKPILCDQLPKVTEDDFDYALERMVAFILEHSNGDIAISKWVSAKRTRSYPYARVYNTLNWSGKKVTIIPIFKDEGKDGDRDFLQFDTISLMSLLQVYVIIAYYADARKNNRYQNKITDQKFDSKYISIKLKEITSFVSDALHWNMEQLDEVGSIADIASMSYKRISENLGVEMHSEKSQRGKIKLLQKGIEAFKEASRASAILAQKREVVTVQPKEVLEGEKATITIRNFYNGFYAFTVDECFIDSGSVYLIEGKHSKSADIPGIDDIKDALLKMILYCNLDEVNINGNVYDVVPVLKLTSSSKKTIDLLGVQDRKIIEALIKEAEENRFMVKLNDIYLS